MAGDGPSSETQGQLVGAGKSLNGREKNLGEEKLRTTGKAPGDKFLNTERSSKRQGHATFKALSWLFFLSNGGKPK